MPKTKIMNTGNKNPVNKVVRILVCLVLFAGFIAFGSLIFGSFIFESLMLFIPSISAREKKSKQKAASLKGVMLCLNTVQAKSVGIIIPADMKRLTLTASQLSGHS